MASPLPTIIILALGAAILGGADTIGALVELTGRSPCLDIAICVFVMFTVTAYLLGFVLLVRFVRDARSGDPAGAGGSGAQVCVCLAQVCMLVSVCLEFLVAACLIALPPPSVPSGGLGALGFFTYLDSKNSFVAVAVAVIAAAAATVVRFAGGEGNAGDAGPGSSERFSRTRQEVCFVFVALLLAAVSYAAASGGLDAQHFFTDVPVAIGVAIATVAVARFSRRVRGAAGGGGSTPATATWRRRFGSAVQQQISRTMYVRTVEQN